MFKKLLVAIDGSESSLKAADIAIELAVRLQARLDILSVEETSPRYVATHEESSREHSATVAYYEKLQAPIRQRAELRGVQAGCAVQSGHEGQAILDYIRDQRCDLLVLGHQGHSGVWGAFLGSTADKLVGHVPCSVLVIRPKMGKALFKHLLVALDGSQLSWQAFQAGLRLAKVMSANLTAVSVIESSVAPHVQHAAATTRTHDSDQVHWDWTTYFQQVLALATTQAQLAGLTIGTMTREGHASDALTDSARTGGYDLLILGATGNAHPLSPTTGGTARKVANEASCAVLLVRPSATQRLVRELMTTDIVAITPQAPLSEVTSLLIEQGLKMLVVVDEERKVLGVVTLGHLLTHGDTLHRLDLQRAVTTTHLSQHVDRAFTTEKTAAEVMIRHPLIVKDASNMVAAARLMLSRHITRVPVVDADQKLVGMLDQSALLRYFADLPEAFEAMPAVDDALQQAERPQTIGEAVLSKVPLVASETPLHEVLRLVQETPLRRVIVVNHDGRALGVIGDRDLLASQGLVPRPNPMLALAGRLSLNLPQDLFHRRSSGPLTAQHMMRPQLVAVTPTTPVTEAVRTMLAHHIKRLVVVDEMGKPLGLVDRQQLLRSLVEGGTLPR